jgi:hypothetical protein
MAVGRYQDQFIPVLTLQRSMTPRVKKIIGTLLILIWIPFYAVVAMSIGVRLLPHAGGLVVFCYYLLAGTLWAIPVGLLFPWMHREHP